MIFFTVPGKPEGKGRPRFRNAGSFVQTYTPEKTRDYEKKIRLCCSEHSGGVKYLRGVALRMRVEACFEPPASTSRRRREKLLESGGTPYQKKPDADNIVKTVQDALNGIAYDDDSQISSVEAVKRYADENCVRVCICPLGEECERNEI